MEVVLCRLKQICKVINNILYALRIVNDEMQSAATNGEAFTSEIKQLGLQPYSRLNVHINSKPKRILFGFIAFICKIINVATKQKTWLRPF